MKRILIVLFFIIFCDCSFGQRLFFEKISGQENDPSTSIHGIAKDSIGYIWFGSWNGVYRYDGRTFDFYYHNPNDVFSLPNNRIRNIFSDKKLGLWFLTFDRKYAKFNYQRNNFKVVALRLVPEVIVEQLNSNSNILNKNKVVNGVHYYLSSHQFTALDLTTRKEFKYSANINQPGSLLDDYITSFFIDDENIIWLGTRGGDIYKANPNRNPFELHYSYVTKNKNTKLATVRAILKVGNKIWLGTDEGMLIYDGNQLDVNNPFYRSNSKINQVRTLFKDNKGGIWIGGVNGLEYYNSQSNQLKPIINKTLSPKLETWSVYAIESYGTTTLWVGLYNSIARINTNDFSIVYFDLAKLMDQHSVMDIISIGQQKLWLGTEGNGIIQLKMNNKLEITNDNSFSSFRNGSAIKKKLSGSIIYALQKDKRGTVWIGTSEGLYKSKLSSNSVQIEKVPLQSDLPNTYISSITNDANGNIWVAHKEGISKINAISGEISNYQKKDQYSSWRFLERAIYNDTLDNTIYFGAKNGYVSFDPSKIKSNSNNNNLILKSLFISNQEVVPMDTIWGKPILTKTLSQTQSLQLDYENRNFTISFASFNYLDNRKEVFEYMMEGYDNNWTKTTANKVSFNKIPAGDYVFKLRLLSPNDTKSPITELNICINAPWYATWYIKLLSVLILLILVYWAFREILLRDRLKNEIKLERLNTEKQEALNKEKIEFFTNISHDLKTPLTLIVDPLKRLQDDKVAPEDKAVYFSIVNRNISYLTKLIYQILDFRKSEIGKLKLNPSAQDFNAFMEECYKTFDFIAKKRNIKLQLHSSESSLDCYLDFEKLEQIITNLLSNAFKYTPDGGTVSIKVLLNKEKSIIEITIEDNGIGIEGSELEKIFEPFNNVGPTPYYGYSSGIGLSLTRNLIQLLQGTIHLESIPKEGTKAIIHLPYVAVVPEESTPKTGEETAVLETERQLENIPVESSKPTLLVVEDNPDVQTYLNKELSKDYELLQEYDGKKGLEAAIKYVPDIIVSDIMMPEMEGTEFCKQLKKNENTNHIPLIFLTAKASDENQIEGFNLGAEAYVMKPFNVDILNAQIKSVLENRTILQNKLAGIKKIEQLQEEIPIIDNDFLEKVIEQVNLNIEDCNFNAEELALKLGISQRQLYRKLKGITGNTVHEFITKIKMNQAETLLKNSDFSISEVAYKLGFSEPSNFSRTFSKHFGCSPSQFLK